MFTLTPAYGRDYTSAAEAVADYLGGKDWRIASVGNPYTGKYCSCRDFPGEQVKLRFNRNEDFTLVTWEPRGLR